ncbi:hypothetical protein [Vibrio phage vB_VpaP_SJSY21]|nr:hypothetical protein [Vibrio phage vB_VpaP_SJSY21]
MLVYTVISVKSDKVQTDIDGQFMLFVDAISAVKYMDSNGLSADDFDVMPIKMEVESFEY